MSAERLIEIHDFSASDGLGPGSRLDFSESHMGVSRVDEMPSMLVESMSTKSVPDEDCAVSVIQLDEMPGMNMGTIKNEKQSFVDDQGVPFFDVSELLITGGL